MAHEGVQITNALALGGRGGGGEEGSVGSYMYTGIKNNHYVHFGVGMIYNKCYAINLFML